MPFLDDAELTRIASQGITRAPIASTGGDGDTGDEISGLVNAIRHVESRGKPNAVSKQGATGSMQIMRDTFNQYAKDGESYDNDADRTAAAIRKIEDDYQHYGGDKAKTAAAYIGGRGAVRSDGTLRDDVKDAEGTTPAAYAEMILARMGKGSGAPKFRAASQYKSIMSSLSANDWAENEGAFSRAGRVLMDPDGGVMPAVGSLMTSALPEGGQKRGKGGFIKDTIVDTAGGIVSAGESLVGLANLASLGTLAPVLKSMGYESNQAQDFLGGFLSADRQEAEHNVQEAKGAWNTLGAMVSHPSVIMGDIVRSLPGILGGGAAAGAFVRKALPGAVAAAKAQGLAGAEAESFITKYISGELADTAAGKAVTQSLGRTANISSAVAEGAQQAGNAAEAGRQSGTEFSTYAPAALASGVLDTGIAWGTGKIGQRLNAGGNVEAGIAQRAAGVPVANAGSGKLIPRTLKGAAEEGTQEFLQSGQEHAFENIATGKPMEEGVGEAAVRGMVTGNVMGGTHALITGQHNAEHAAAVQEIKTAPDINSAIAAAQKASYVPAAPLVDIDSPEYQARDAERLARLQAAADKHVELLANVGAQANATNREAAVQAMQEQLARDMPPVQGGSALVNAMPQAAAPGVLEAKQAAIDAQRAYIETQRPGQELQTALVPKQQPLADATNMDMRQVQNRLTVLRDQLKQQGGDPSSLVAVPSTTVMGAYNIKNLDPQVQLNPTQTGNTALAQDVGVGVMDKPKVIDPTEAFLNVKRREGTQQARAFMQAYDRGELSPEDVQRAMANEQQRTGPLPASYNKDGTPFLEGTETGKARGQSALRQQVVNESFVPPAPRETPKPAEEPPGQPGAAAPSMTQGEFNAKMPVNNHNPEVHAANTAGDFGALANALAKSANPTIRRVGELAKSLVGTVKLEKSRASIGGALGHYVPAKDVVHVIKAHAGDEWVSAHEVAHAFSSRAMRAPTAAQKPIVQRIEKLYEHVKKELRKQGYRPGSGGGKELYGLTNAREFISEGFTNQNFQRLLTAIPYQKRSAWSAFVEAVGKLLGFNGQNNALTELLQHTEKLAEMGRPKNAVWDKAAMKGRDTADETVSTPESTQYTALTGKKITYPVHVQDTNETAQVTADAVRVLDESKQRLDTLEQLMACMK